MELTPEQLKAYDRFIRARDKVKLVKTSRNYAQKYIPHRDYVDSVHIVGLNHPLFIENDDWIEYKEASAVWWEIEPEFRNVERLRATRGDYGSEDNWEETTVELETLDQYFKGQQ